MSVPQFEAPDIEEVHELLPAYDVLDFIAKGGMGAVYRARQISLDREVAIKILPREFGEDADFRSGFEAEAKAMAKLNHPNLIAVYDFGEVDGMPYIVMEFVNGKALHYSAHGKAIEQKEAARITLGICEGLAHAHEAGILHRDIKPANILLDSKKNPKIGDFGLARPVEADGGGGVIFGTPGYSAPEVLNHPDKVDKRSDVFATGVILYELLTGELPGDHYVPASKKASVDPRFDQIVRRATHPSPSLRFSDAGAMAVEVRKLLDGLSKPQAATIVTSASAPKAKPVEDDAGERPEVPVPAPGTNWAFLRNLVIIVVLLAAIYGMWEAIKWKEADTERRKREFDAEQLARKQEQERKAEEERVRRREEREAQARVIPKVSEEMINPVERKPETPLDVLERLRPSLADGERTMFPPATLERGIFRYFLVESPMSWQEAATFAEKHGGHLATIRDDAERNWFSTKIPPNTVIWLGGGAVGRSAWGWVDGSKWTIRQPSTATGNTATLSDLGTVKAKPAGENYPFFIQWNMEGDNPGGLRAQLERTTETLESPNPLWPPGTLFFESRRYLIVNRPGTWDEAAALASLANGHLAVPSEPAESDYLMEAAANALGAGGTCWIGGQHNGRSFAWTTGEAWTFASWAPDFPDPEAPSESVVRLATGPDGGWQHVDGSDPDGAQAFIIEWSKDSEVKREVVVAGAAGELGKLQKIANGHVDTLRDKHRKEVRDNTKFLVFELDGWVRRQPKSVQTAWAPRVHATKKFIDMDGRFQVPDSAQPALHAEARKLVLDCIDKQTRLDSTFAIDLDKFRLVYIDKLNDAREDLLARGLKGEVHAIDNEIAACGTDAGTFHEHVTGEPLPSTEP